MASFYSDFLSQSGNVNGNVFRSESNRKSASIEDKNEFKHLSEIFCYFSGTVWYKVFF